MTRQALGRRLLISLWALGSLCVGAVALGAEDIDTGLAEIVVTAQKYESTIQNTPFSISAVTGEQLAAAGMRWPSHSWASGGMCPADHRDHRASSGAGEAAGHHPRPDAAWGENSVEHLRTDEAIVRPG